MYTHRKTGCRDSFGTLAQNTFFRKCLVLGGASTYVCDTGMVFWPAATLRSTATSSSICTNEYFMCVVYE